MARLLRAFLLVMAVLFFTLPAHAQLKPEALVIPVYFVGIKDASARRILQQHVLTELSQSFELRSEQEVAQAREKAADKLASSDCTEAACLKVMGELLDVDYMFAVLVSASGNYWDLTGIRLEPLGRTVRKSVECPDCTLPKARAGLTKLLLGLRPGAVGIERGKAVLILESEPSGLVFLEGVEQGETPIELTVPSDRPAEILVFAEGYQDYSNLFDLKPGERRTVQIRLVKRRGRVRITSNPPGAVLFLDGQPLRDASGKQQSTPAETRLEYGKHTLRLTLEKHQDTSETLTVKRPDLGTKTYTLTPNPGRLVVRVPPELKDGAVYANEKYLGGMGGKIVKSFEVQSNTSFKIHVENSSLITDKILVRIKPEETQKIEYNEFQNKITEPNAFEKLLEKDWSNQIYAHNRRQLGYGSMPVRYEINDKNKGIISGDMSGEIIQFEWTHVETSGVFSGYSMGLSTFTDSEKNQGYQVKDYTALLDLINWHYGRMHYFDDSTSIRGNIYLGMGLGYASIYGKECGSYYCYYDTDIQTMNYNFFHYGFEVQLDTSLSNENYFGLKYSIHRRHYERGYISSYFTNDIENAVIKIQPSIQLVYGWRD